MHSGLGGDRALLWSIAALLAGALCWAVGSIVSTAGPAQGQQLCGGSVADDCRRGFQYYYLARRWANGRSFTQCRVGRIARLSHHRRLATWLTGYIYLLEHVPVAKVMSYTYVNPVVAVLLGIFFLHERPVAGGVRRHGRHRDGSFPADDSAG